MWVATHFSEILKKKTLKYKNVWQFFSKFKLKNALLPQFYFWILIAIAKISFFHMHSHKPRKNIVVLEGKFLKKPEYPEIRRKYAQ